MLIFSKNLFIGLTGKFITGESVDGKSDEK
jgi:hypothetical protein